jgi:hypothetical protein
MPVISTSENMPSIIANAAASVGRVVTARVIALSALPSGTFATQPTNIKGNTLDTYTVTATGTLTIDGVVVALNDIIAVFGQATQSQNGIYIVATAGAVGVAAVLRRSEEMGNSVDLQHSRVIVTSNEGSQYGNSIYLLNAPATSGTLDTTALSATLLAKGGSSVASTPAFYARGVVTSLSGTYSGSGTGTLTAAANSAFGTQDGISNVSVNDVFLLPAGTTSIGQSTDAGPYIVTSIGATNAKWTMQRPSWWYTGMAWGTGLPMGNGIQVGPEGTLFQNSKWKSWAAPGAVVDSNDPLLYPDRVCQSVTLAAGLSTITNVPIRSSTKSRILPVLATTGGTLTGTVGYEPYALTPGALNTATVQVRAIQSGLATQTSDTSTLTVEITN